MYVLAMNRLRAAYIELDPGIAQSHGVPARRHAGFGADLLFSGTAQLVEPCGGEQHGLHQHGEHGAHRHPGRPADVLLGGAGTAMAASWGYRPGLAFLAWSSVHGYRSYAAVWDHAIAGVPARPGNTGNDTGAVGHAAPRAVSRWLP